MLKTKLPVVVGLLLTLCISSACSTPAIEQGQPTLDIYRESRPTTKLEMRSFPQRQVNTYSYSRSEANVLRLRFPLLPNPSLSLYVFPHLKDGAPVPGYVTSFKLYDRDIYALPGEQ